MFTGSSNICLSFVSMEPQSADRRKGTIRVLKNCNTLSLCSFSRSATLYYLHCVLEVSLHGPTMARTYMRTCKCNTGTFHSEVRWILDRGRNIVPTFNPFVQTRAPYSVQSYII